MTVVPFDTTHTTKPPCQWGPCGHCTAGRHTQCQFVRWAHLSTARPGPHGWITDNKGRVAFPNVAVYVNGNRETWICTCHVEGHGDGQLDLFGGAA